MRHATKLGSIGALGVLLMVAACKREASPPTDGGATPTPPASTSPTPSAPAWDAEGATFTGPAAGGRGGAYSYKLCAGGKYVRWCLDADCDRGTWRRDGDVVVLVSENPDTKGQETRLNVSADGQTLGPPDIEGGPLTRTDPPAADACG